MTPFTEQQIGQLLVDKTAEVLAVDRAQVTLDAGLLHELHADSLDLVEIVEGVEATLRRRGWRTRLPEEELVAAATVADIARRMHRRLEPVP